MPTKPIQEGAKREDLSRVTSETDLVQTYLAPLADGMPGAFGLADDAALVSSDPGTDLVFSTDPIIAGVHFFPDDHPRDIAWKALAVNVSDIAAKGARPTAYLMTLAFPEAPLRSWMAEFAHGLAEAQTEFGCRLIGGDTDRMTGPLSIGVTMIGTLPSGTFVKRHGARSGDHVFVTGTIGDAALGLALRRNPALFSDALSADDRRFLIDRYLRPRPRYALAPVLRTYATAALDISDGLLKDLTRLAGNAGLVLRFPAIPLSRAARKVLAADQRVCDAILGGGGDYELLAAVSPDRSSAFAEGAREAGIDIHNIGMVDGADIHVLDADGTKIGPREFGYDHFSS
ncbi:thiamine-phosphate kinase [Hyphomicrobium sp.]|jgi:thiamine-monophosphate kinase|uniref:thiamine-phosphate kinase n=1 Tax=Hyphomicrobium sp. TaxID=82 RepID=UPI002C5FB96B|nr:thiamine-phosphate kinase [Hyphomicrobium sp.]HVZ04974.1 thiamine-phosphate kinase [Hyphomicrobium sp.]